MSDFPGTQEHRAHVAAVVRRNVWPAAIAAVLMCYFGFDAPWVFNSGASPLLKNSAHLFDYTLQIGGVVMAGVAVWCLLGMVAALAVDGVVSVAIGLLFILSGGGMVMAGSIDLNSILIILFGTMFFGSGRYNWRTYCHLAKGGRVVEQVYEETFLPPAAPVESARSPEAPIPVESPAPIERPTFAEPSTPAEPTAAETPAPEGPDIPEPEAPPEGFLAAMAKRPPTHDGT